MAKKKVKEKAATEQPEQNVPATPEAQAPSPYPQTEEGLKADGWNLTHQAGNGNFLYTKATLEGLKYAEVSEGKVVEVRTTQ